MNSNTLTCYITSLRIQEDAAALYTRIYPYGAGNAGARLTILDADIAMPTGYTLDTANNFIKRDAAETGYGRIDHVEHFKDIGASDGTGVRDRGASNQLARAALTLLQTHSYPYTSYALEVTGLKTVLKVGQLIWVEYREYRDGYTALDLKEQMLILERTNRIDNSGIRTVGLVVTSPDTARYPETDAQAQAKQFEQVRRSWNATQGVRAEQVR